MLKAVLDTHIEEMRDSRQSRIALLRKTSRGIANGKGRLGILPASFNPVTSAHLSLIEEADKRGGFDEILVLLDLAAMDKKPVEARFEDRLKMLEEVFQKVPKVSIGWSTHGLFLDKLKPLREYYPPPVQFFFIVGFDTILRVMDRRYYARRKESLDELFRQGRFLVANRGDLEEQAFERLFRKRDNRRYKDRVSFFTLPRRVSFLSSTVVRERVSLGQPIQGWVPASVHRFIERKGLYRSP